MPNPPTPEELEGWETLYAKAEWDLEDADEASRAFGALLAEVKRLREENAKDSGTPAAWYGNVIRGACTFCEEDATVAGTLDTTIRVQPNCCCGATVELVSTHTRSVSPNASTAPRTTPRL